MPTLERPARPRSPGVALVILLASIALASGAVAGAPVGAAPPATTPTPAAPERSATVADNDFIPQDVDLSACISANPQPGCGSENRSGWHQYLILVAVIIGVIVISWRIVASVRARDRSLSGR